MPDPEIEYVQALVDRAKHDSVTPERLANKKIGFKRYRLHDKPLYDYLQEQEQPHFLFHAVRGEPEFNGPNAPDPIQRSLRYRVMHLITNRRWLMVAGNTAGDQVCEIGLDAIEATNHDPGGRLRNNVFVVELENAHISVPMANDYTEEDLQALSRYLRDQGGAVRGGVAVDSDEANYTISGDDAISYSVEDVRNRLDQCPDESMGSANEVVADADTVDELIPRLDNLIEEYEDEGQTLDDVVRKADSADELRREVEKPTERAQRRMKENATASAERLKQTADDVRETAKQSDPEEVGRWALHTGRAAKPMARAAPYSTPVILLGALTAGASAGVFASGSDSELLEDIDPAELEQAAMDMVIERKDVEAIDGEAVGAVLGAFSYLGGQLAPEDYARWIQEADPEAILAGADAGAQFARAEQHGTARQGSVAGAAVGLFGSYTVDSDEGLRETLDEDLYKDYLEESDQRDRSLLE